MQQYDAGDSVVRFDWTDSESVAAAVVGAVASTTGTDPTELPSLYDAIDPDALDRFFSRPDDTDDHRSVSFSFADCRVVVTADGTGRVEP